MWHRTRPQHVPQTRAQTLADDLGVLERVSRFGGDLRMGAPTPCPKCGRVGHVDAVDDGVQRNHCTKCRERWAFSAKAMALYRSARAQDNIVVGSGVLVADLRDGWKRQTSEHFVSVRAAMRNSQRVAAH